jgi:hypothetical protein
MIFKLRVEDAKDERGKKLRAMFITLITENEGLGDINAVAELTKGSPLQIEIDGIIEDMVESKKKQIKESNRKKIAKLKK